MATKNIDPNSTQGSCLSWLYQIIFRRSVSTTSPEGLPSHDNLSQTNPDFVTIDSNCTLGNGQFGNVVQGTYQNQKVAVKIANSEQKNANEILTREAQTMSSLKGHDNVVELLNTFNTDDGKFCVAMEFCNQGDLNEWRKKYQKISLYQITGFMDQVYAGLDHIHSKGFIHCDLKPANLLLSAKSDKLIVKIADFGGSFQSEIQGAVEPVKREYDLVFSPAYGAPEFYLKDTFILAPALDIWSASCIFYYLTLESYIFDTPLNSKADQQPELCITKQLNNLQGLFNNNPNDFFLNVNHGDYVNLIFSGLKIKPSERPTAINLKKACGKLLTSTPNGPNEIKESELKVHPSSAKSNQQDMISSDYLSNIEGPATCSVS